MAFWGIEIKPGKPHLHQFDDERGRLHLSQATLGSGSSKEKAVVVCNVGDKKPIYLCSLLPRKMETCSLNIEFEEYDEVTFSVEGPHSIHLSGFFYGEKPDSDGDDYESDSDEEGSLEAAEMGSEDDSDFAFDEEDDLTDNEMDMMPNSGVRIEEIVDEDQPANENATPAQSKKNKKDNSQGQIVVKKPSNVPVLESEDEDGFPISSKTKEKTSVPESKQESEGTAGKGQNGQGKRKKGTDDSEKSAKKKKDESVKGDDTTSQPEKIEAPTPESDVKKSKKKKKNKKEKDTKEDSNNNNKNEIQEEETNQDQTPGKAKKEKQKNKPETNTPGSKVKESENENKPSQIRTFPNGLVIEEIQMGKPNGKRADPGKKISMRYIGKLKKNGKIFDSNIGQPPFKFRLGVGQVIAGWDVGVKGMRVGDKRRLTIPPAMGYGAKGAGAAIPPNAWLVFDVELIDVN